MTKNPEVNLAKFDGNLERNGVAIPFKGGMANLTAMWKACDKKSCQRPAKFMESVEGREFIKELAKKAGKSPKSGHFVRVIMGRSGGTWAHWQIAMKYAAWLNPEFAMWVNEVAAQFVQQDAQGVPYVEQKTADAAKDIEGTMRAMASSIITGSGDVAASTSQADNTSYFIENT